MKKFLLAIVLAFGMAHADDDMMMQSAATYHKIMGEYSGTAQLVGNAQGILIFPSIKKIGLIVGGMYGKGTALVRSGAGWSAYPAELSNASIGAQIGYEDNGLVMYLMDAKLIDDMRSSKLKLGADVTATIAEASANLGSMNVFNRDMYVFMDKSGAFAGVSLGGVVIAIAGDQPESGGTGYSTLMNVINSGR